MDKTAIEFQQLFREIHSKFSRRFGTILSIRDITVPQFYVLSFLFHEGSLQMNQLAERLRITRPAVTNLVGRLVKENYVERVADERDRRVILIRLKAKGRTLVEKAQAKLLNLFIGTISQFTVPEQQVIKRFYQRLSASIDTFS